MEKFSFENKAKIKDNENIGNLICERIKKLPKQNLFEYKNNKNIWNEVKPSEFYDEIKKLSAGILKLGIKKGEAVGILSQTSYEWVQLDFALLTIGALAVPIYDTSSESQIKHILNNAKIKHVFVQNTTLAKKISKSTKSKIYIIENNIIDAIKSEITLENLEQAKKQAKTVVADDLATIVYTSGSTGTPKGVELTHRNFLTIIRNGLKGMPELLMRDNARLLLFLPLAHVFARYLEYVCVAGTTTMGIVSDTKTLLADLEHFKPTYMLGVPRVFEKVLNAASQKADHGIKEKIFKNAVKTAIQNSKNQENNKKTKKIAKIKTTIYSKLVYSQIKNALGGNVEYIVSGGAALNPEIAHFFIGAGVPILEGYGLTETAAPTMVNRVNANIAGTVGQPLPGIQAKIAKDGELLLKSESIMQGYHNLPELTNETIKNGWLHTGDIGEISETGHITITGRKKDIIVTAGGKNVSPSPLEETIKAATPIISEVVVIGEKKPFISALITLEKDNLAHFLQKNRRKKTKDAKTAKKDPLVISEIDSAVAKANAQVSRAESIRKYYVLDEDFSEDNGQLTASAKVRRNEVIQKNEKLIEREIYKQIK